MTFKKCLLLGPQHFPPLSPASHPDFVALLNDGLRRGEEEPDVADGEVHPSPGLCLGLCPALARAAQAVEVFLDAVAHHEAVYVRGPGLAHATDAADGLSLLSGIHQRLDQQHVLRLGEVEPVASLAHGQEKGAVRGVGPFELAQGLRQALPASPRVEVGDAVDDEGVA